MASKFLMTFAEKRTLVLQLVAEELAFERYGGVQKAVDDANKLISTLTKDQVRSIFVGSAKTGLEMMTFGTSPPKRYDVLKVIREFQSDEKSKR